MGRSSALLALAGALLAVLALSVQPPATSSAPTPAQSSCVGCHTNPTALGPLVKPFPVIPAEGEG
jgi:hypothetical protein